MANLVQLSALGKAIMGSLVDAEMLGLGTVRGYLGMAFDELAREALALRRAGELEELESVAKEYEEEEVGG